MISAHLISKIVISTSVRIQSLSRSEEQASSGHLFGEPIDRACLADSGFDQHHDASTVSRFIDTCHSNSLWLGDNMDLIGRSSVNMIFDFLIVSLRPGVRFILKLIIVVLASILFRECCLSHSIDSLSAPIDRRAPFGYHSITCQSSLISLPLNCLLCDPPFLCSFDYCRNPEPDDVERFRTLRGALKGL